MRKPLIAVLCILLLIALAVPAFAAGNASIAASNSVVYRNGVFTVVISASGWGKCTTGSVEVSHGGSFELTAGDWLISSPDISYFDVGAREGGFGYSSGKDIAGNLIKLTFKVKSNASFVKENITVSIKLGGSQVTKSIEIPVACAHAYSNWANASSTAHTRKCSICGNTETADHSYDNDCDTTCNGCGAVRTITHQYGQDWISDATGHWHACAVCGEKADVAEHTPGEEAGEYTDQICTVCKFVLTPALGHTHRYDETFKHDTEGHWQECTGCKEATETVAHIFDGDCDETCNECTYQRKITHQDGDWEYSEDGHWKTCGNCKAKLHEGTHTWDAGFIKEQATTQKTGLTVYHCTVCMAERQETVPKALPTDPAGGWAWWIWMAIGAGGGVIVTAGVGVLIIALSVKKKSKGRFSG